MYWQPDGRYLCILVHKNAKGNKPKHSVIEVFDMQSRNYPSQVVELNSIAHYFAWEPKAARFGVIHGENPKPDVSFYEIGEKIKLLSKNIFFGNIFFLISISILLFFLRNFGEEGCQQVVLVLSGFFCSSSRPIQRNWNA